MDPLENQFKFIKNQSSTEIYYKNIISSLRETKSYLFPPPPKRKIVYTPREKVKNFSDLMFVIVELCVGLQKTRDLNHTFCSKQGCHLQVPRFPSGGKPESQKIVKFYHRIIIMFCVGIQFSINKYSSSTFMLLNKCCSKLSNLS